MANGTVGGLNLAKRYAKKVDERFNRESFLANALNNDYDFKGVKTVEVYSIPTVRMNDYSRSGTSRYGTASDAVRNIQELVMSRDRSFTTVIDKGDKLQSDGVMDAGKFLSRQIREACVPEYDAYGFAKLANAAISIAHTDTTAITDENAYEMFLKANAAFGDCNVPDTGRVAYCSYTFANLLAQDAAFVKDSELAQNKLIKGTFGEVDGCRLVRVPASRLPAGAAFLLLHPLAACGPKQLEEFKIHENPPGISGWLIEGRLIYDMFVLDSKADAIWYHGGQAALKPLSILTAGATDDDYHILINPAVKSVSTNKWYYTAAATVAALTAVSYGEALSLGGGTPWTEITEPQIGYLQIAASTNKFVRVVEADANGYPVGVGTAAIKVSNS